MIFLSLILVIVAAVTLVLGVFQDGLELIYVSIGTCVAAMAVLGVGVLLRKRGDQSAAASAYADRDTTDRTAPASASVDDASDEGSVTVRETAAQEPASRPAAQEPASRPAAQEPVSRSAAQEPASRPVAKKAVVRKVAASPTVESSGSGVSGAAGAGAAAAAARTSRSAGRVAGGRDDVATPAPSSDGPPETPRSAERTPQRTVPSVTPVPATSPAAATPAKKATAKKTTAKKTTAKKAAPSTRKAAAKKVTAKKAAPSTRKATAKKATAKKATAKKSTAKKATATQAATRRSGSLTAVKSLGPTKQKALLDAFGSEDGIAAASVAQIAAVKGVGQGLARAIKDELG